MNPKKNKVPRESPIFYKQVQFKVKEGSEYSLPMLWL